MFKYFGLVFQLLPLVAAMMAQVEEAGRDGTYSGEEKKGLVLAALKSAIQGMLAVSTGGQLETWERISPNLSGIIDNLAAILFPHSD